METARPTAVPISAPAPPHRTALTVPLPLICTAILARTAGGLAEVALFNAANQWRTAVMFLPSMLGSALLPVLSSLRATNTKNTHTALSFAQQVVFLATVPAALALMLLAPHVMAAYGEGFAQGAPAFILVIAGAAISSVGSPAGTAIQSRGVFWLGFWQTLGFAAVVLCAATAWRGRGATGMATAIYVGHVALALCGYWYLRKDLPEGMLRRTVTTVLVITFIAMALASL